jgi:hypothetical protein
MVLSTSLHLLVVLALIIHWQSTFNLRVQQNFLAALRRHLYQTVEKRAGSPGRQSWIVRQNDVTDDLSLRV